MSLPPDYLHYPHRAYGMDQARYPWRPAPQRPKTLWPEQKAVALLIVVPIEFHMLNPTGKPFKHPGAMQTPYPDLRHFTTRDYGNRVGVYRILKELKSAGLKACFAINARQIDRAKPLIGAVLADGHEIAAHGWDTDSLHWGGIHPDTEKRFILDTRDAFDAAGLSPRTWMSPARQHSFKTLDLIRAAGFDVCLDWEMDCVPTPVATEHGPVSCVPLISELDDRKLLIEQRQTETEWRDQILAANDLMQSEYASSGGQVLSFTLTPYVSGQPFRIWALRDLFHRLSRDPLIWNAAAGAIAEAAVA